MNSYTIRAACPKDAQDLLNIYTPYVKNTSITFEYAAPTTGEFEERISRVTERFPWLVCECDGRSVGYAYASAFHERAAFQWDAELSVYFIQEYQGRGLAFALYHCIYNLLKQQGYYKLYSLVTVPNPQSVRFHKSRGFTEVGRYQNTGYKLGGWHDMIVLECLLAPLPENPLPPKRFHDLPKEIVQSILLKEQEQLNQGPN